MDDIAIKVDHVSKTFRLPHERQNSIKGTLISMVRGGKRTYEKQRVLKDVSFEIKKGEFFGIVGRNGSGKSTLLKMMAGIYPPTAGQIQVNGKLTPFIELGVGFSPELTGRENVFLNGALLGFSRREMEEMYSDIVEFAELEKFMDQKLKNYSSGMQVRLAFSIAIRAQSDILILDEVLAVGDAAFQNKCQEYFREVKNMNKTVVLVTHDMSAVERYCDKAILINNGEIELAGKPAVIASAYQDINRAATNQEIEKEQVAPKAKKPSIDEIIRNGAVIEDVTVTNAAGARTRTFKYGETIHVSVKYGLEQDIQGAVLDIGLTLGKNGPTYVYSDTLHKKIAIDGHKGKRLTAGLSVKNIFSGGVYYVVTSLYDPSSLKVYARNRSLAKLSVDDPPFAGVVAPEHTLELTQEKS